MGTKTTTREKETGSTNAPVIPFLVKDDAGDDLTLADATAEAITEAPSTFFGLPQRLGRERHTRLSQDAIRVHIQYGTDPAPDSDIGDERVRFNFQVRPVFLNVATEIAKFPSGTAPSMGGMLNVRRGAGGGNAVGATIPAPVENLGKTKVVSVATAESLASTIASAVGYVNSVAIGGYAIGELMLTSFRGTQPDDTKVFLDLGWSYLPNVSSATFGDITGVSYNGHDYVWALTKDVVDRNDNVLYQQPKYIYVNRVRPYGDISQIGINPP